MDKIEIDWAEIDKEHEMHIKKCAELDKIIAEERKNPAGIEDLERRTKIVNEFIEENKIDSLTLNFDEKKRNK